MVRYLLFCILIIGLAIFGCTQNHPTYTVDRVVAKHEKAILVALFNASDRKLSMDTCEAHTFTTMGEFLADIYSAEGRLQKVYLSCPMEENGNLYCEFNLPHDRDNTLVRFVFDPRQQQLLETFQPECLRVP